MGRELFGMVYARLMSSVGSDRVGSCTPNGCVVSVFLDWIMFFGLGSVFRIRLGFVPKPWFVPSS